MLGHYFTARMVTENLFLLVCCIFRFNVTISETLHNLLLVLFHKIEEVLD